MPLFGEVVEPVSRALYIDESSDEEDNLEDSGTNVINVNWEDDTPTSPNTILVFYGQLAADFLQKVLQGLNPKSAAKLKEKLFNRHKVPKELNLQMYKLSTGIYGCFCPNVDMGKSTSLVLDELVPVFKRCNQVIVVCSLPAPFYKGNDSTLDLPAAFMRVLYTSTFDCKDVVAPLLESPNLVTGVPASILSWCEVFDKPACLYVSYSDSSHLDSISAEPLVNIFSNVCGGVFKTNVLSFQTAIPEPSSNLYI